MSELHVSQRHRTLVLPHRSDVASLVPHARRFQHQGQDLLALPHKPDEVMLLRNLGIDAPAPILWQYDWNGDTPFETQRKTAAMLSTNRRAYVLSAMGCGKTRATLYALDYLHRCNDIRRAIVVAPLSTLNMVWEQEIRKHFSHLRTCVLYGTKEKRLKLLRETDADVYIINHDGLRIVADAIARRGDFDALVLDELAVYRTPGAKRSKHMRKFAQAFTYVWGLTGAPTPNAPTDAWSQAKIVTPRRAPEYFRAFKNQTMTQISTFIWVPKRDAMNLVADMLKPCVRFTRDETVELPPVVVQDRQVPLGKGQQEFYTTLMRHCQLAYAEHRVNAANEGVLMNKLLQVCTGAVYSDKGHILLDPTARLQMLNDIIDEAGQKVIVFVPFVHTLKLVADHVAKKCSVATVHGQTPKTERDQVFYAFQNKPDPHVIVAHPATMAHGLTLTAANCIVWYAPMPSLETYDQANARISRPGQKHKQLVVNLWGAPVEQRIAKRLRKKSTMQGLLLNMLEGIDETY